MVTRSSAEAEAEFRAFAHGICEGIWIKRVLEELKISLTTPIQIYFDNRATISISYYP